MFSQPIVVLSMAVIKRFRDCLLPTHGKVQETYAKVEKLAVKDGFLKEASGYRFYNTGKFTFELLTARYHLPGVRSKTQGHGTHGHHPERLLPVHGGCRLRTV